MKMGKRVEEKSRFFIKPSPNEEAKLLTNEKEKLRKLRIQQVREQEKLLANRVRERFKRKEKNEISLLKNKLERAWLDDINDQQNTLERIYCENVSHVGQGHQDARVHVDTAPGPTSIEEELKVEQRYKQAVKKVRADQISRDQQQNERNQFKEKAMEAERIRASKVAAMEPAVPDIVQALDLLQKQKNKHKNIEQFNTTYYHLPKKLVERAEEDDQIDAREAAKDEGAKIQDAKEEADRNFAEQLEKARLRHEHARSKLLLQQDHDKLLKELEHFERIDRQRRQEIVAKIPKHVFEPPHRRQETKLERQRELERAFEDMYMAQTNYMGDVTLVREPFPSGSTTSPETPDELSRQEEDLFNEKRNIEDIGEQQKINVVDGEPSAQGGDQGDDQEDQIEVPGSGKRKILEEAQKSRTAIQPTEKDPLKRLMKKIDAQRDRWKVSNQKKALDDNTEHHVLGSVSSDKDSEFSEGLLTISTDRAHSVMDSSSITQKETLLHPYEKAQKIRTATTVAHKPPVKESIQAESDDIEKQKQLLQQQKLKLQLEQQQVLQEHLQLQFDMLQKETAKMEQDDHKETLDVPAKREKEKEMFSSVSTGLLSDDDRASASEADIGTRIEITPPITSHRIESRLSSVPESVFEDSFVQLSPMSDIVISQPKPLHFEIPVTRKEPAYREEKIGTYFDKQPTEGPIVLSTDVIPDQDIHRPVLTYAPSREPSTPTSHPPTSTISTSDNEIPIRFQLPTGKASDTVSYLKFYQEQLVEQQERIREQQRTIQERQQKRLDQLKQFQEQLRSLRTTTSSDSSPKQTTGNYWRSLRLASDFVDASSSSTSDNRSIIGPSLSQQSTTSAHSKEDNIENESDKATSASSNESPSPYPSDIVPVPQYENIGIFPNTSALGLWSDSTIQLSLSEATRSSSNNTQDIDQQKHTRMITNDFNPSFLNTQSFTDESSTNSKSKSTQDNSSSSLSTSTLPKSLSSSTSDSNNNALLDNSLKHFQNLIEEAKILNKKYLNKSYVESDEDIVEEAPSFEIMAGQENALGNEYSKSTLPPIPEESQVDSVNETLNNSSGKLGDSFEEVLSDHDFRPLENMDYSEISKRLVSNREDDFTKERSEAIIDAFQNQQATARSGMMELDNVIVNDSRERIPSDISTGVSDVPYSSVHHGEHSDNIDSSYVTLDEVHCEHVSSDETGGRGTAEQSNEHSVEQRNPRVFLRSQNTPMAEQSDISKNCLPQDIKNSLHVDHEPSIIPSESTNEVTRATSSNNGLQSSFLNQSSSKSEGSDLSLQDAFKKFKSKFLKDSEERVRAAKEARSKPIQPPVFNRKNKETMKTTTKSDDKNPDDKNGKHSQFESVNDNLKTKDTKPMLGNNRKIDKQDMKARTQRLYQKLPDVRKKQNDKKREELYAANRAKVQEFQKQTRERLRKLKEKRSGK